MARPLLSRKNQEHGRAVGNRMAVSEQNSRESFQARRLGKPEDIQGRLDSLEEKTLVLINSEGNSLCIRVGRKNRDHY